MDYKKKYQRYKKKYLMLKNIYIGGEPINFINENKTMLNTTNKIKFAVHYYLTERDVKIFKETFKLYYNNLNENDKKNFYDKFIEYVELFNKIKEESIEKNYLKYYKDIIISDKIIKIRIKI